MSSRREHPTNTTSARPARRGAQRAAGSSAATEPPLAHSGATSDDAHLNGLFTYCLSVMCDHDEAVTALGQALAVAERQREREKAPDGPGRERPWLYALARWSCLRRLNAQQQNPKRGEPVKLTGPLATQRRQELAALGWPEAAGITPEQREALELAVRHGLPVDEVALVLSMETPSARLLLSSAACEVERTRAALSVVNKGGCSTVSSLGGDTEVVLSTALRRELVRHVDECSACRLAAERHMAGEPWPGTAPGRARQLVVLPVSRPVVHAALVTALRARSQPMPRFDRKGFPVESKDRAARLERLRTRAVTTTVVAAVVAAPVLALWAAYRGAPLVGEGRDGGGVSATESDDPAGADGYPYENAGNADRAERSRQSPQERDTGPVDVEEDGKPSDEDSSTAPEDDPDDEGSQNPEDGSDSPSPGRLTVQAQPAGDATMITLTNSGGSPLNWSAYAEGRWLRLSQSSGRLQPGESFTLTVTVNRRLEPEGPWSARVHIAPANAVITIEGQGRDPDPDPSDPDEPTPSPSEPDPEPTPSE